MAEVNIMVHGRTYGVGCDGGQEKRVRELGQYIDKRVKEIAGAGGAATEAHLLVLTNLVLADEAFEARDQMQQLRNQLAVQGTEMETLQKLLEEQSETTGKLSAQIEHLQSRMAQGNAGQGAGAADGANAGMMAAMDPEVEARLCATIDSIAVRLDNMTKRLIAA